MKSMLIKVVFVAAALAGVTQAAHAGYWTPYGYVCTYGSYWFNGPYGPYLQYGCY